MKKRCFIENDYEVIDFDKEYFESKTNVLFEEAFSIIVTEASSNKESVWKAIIDCDEIWMSTSFVGSSDTLFGEMLALALKHGIRDKVVVNLNEYKDAAWHISDENRKAMWAISDSNNIRFVFKDDWEEYREILLSISTANS